MAYQLKTTVFVKDPDSHQTVILDPGTCPEPRLAALVDNPAAWVDGKMPRPKPAKTEPDTDPVGPPAGGPDGDAGGPEAGPGPDGADEPPADEPDEKPAARTAKKTAGRKPATTATEGTGGQ